MEINGKYKRKGSVGTNVFIPTDMQEINNENYVLFENGAKCKLSTFKNDFELIGNGENNTVNENNVIDDDGPIDPDAFFESGNIGHSLADQVDKIATDPNYVQNLQKGPSRQESRDLSQDKQPPAHMMGDNNAVNYDLNNRLTDDNQQNLQPNQQNLQPQINKTNRLPEHDIFDRVKANSELEIIIPFKLTIPKSQKIDTMDDMFESSFIEYLAEKYVNENIVNNLDILKELINKGIEEWVEKDLESKRKKKATVKTDTFEIKEDKPETKKEEPKEKEIKTDNVDDLTNKLRNTPQNENVDISKLYIINTENQYNAVKKQYEQYKENNPNHPDIDRLEDMLNIYDEQIAEINKRSNDATNDATNDVVNDATNDVVNDKNKEEEE